LKTEIEALHAELSYIYRAPPLYSRDKAADLDKRRITVIPGLVMHAYRYHGSFRVAEVDGGWVGFNKLWLSKKMCANATLVDVLLHLRTGY